MDNIAIYQIDAFTDKVFYGNPAAVCLLDDWLNDELLQAIATENNLSETAFVMEDSTGFHIRWFTPRGEINLCGHATLAAGFVLFEEGKASGEVIHFASLSGELTVLKKGDKYTLDFPRLSYAEMNPDNPMSGLINKKPLACYESDLDYFFHLKNEKDVATAVIDLSALAKLPKRGLILTSKSSDADFYSRCFYPKHNVPEDPVTGSAHCVLTPFWSDILGKTHLTAIQGSYRKGTVFCELKQTRVLMSGYCRWYLKGHLQL